MSGPRARCPSCSLDIRASRRISGPSHSRMHFCAVLLSDVRAPSARQMSGLLAGYPGIGVQRTFLCWAARRMSGHLPDVRAFLLCRMSGLDPGCPAPLFSALVLFSVPHILPGRMSGPLPGCPACSFTYTTTAIFMLTLYIPLVLHGRGLTIHFEQTLEHFSLSLSFLHTKS